MAWFGSVRPWAVTTLVCPLMGFRATSLQFWNTTAALPKMKSTVPVT